MNFVRQSRNAEAEDEMSSIAECIQMNIHLNSFENIMYSTSEHWSAWIFLICSRRKSEIPLPKSDKFPCGNFTIETSL